MKKASKYRRHAEKCHFLANGLLAGSSVTRCPTSLECRRNWRLTERDAHPEAPRVGVKRVSTKKKVRQLYHVYFEKRSFSSLGSRMSLTQRRSAMTKGSRFETHLEIRHSSLARVT